MAKDTLPDANWEVCKGMSSTDHECKAGTRHLAHRKPWWSSKWWGQTPSKPVPRLTIPKGKPIRKGKKWYES